MQLEPTRQPTATASKTCGPCPATRAAHPQPPRKREAAATSPKPQPRATPNMAQAAIALLLHQPGYRKPGRSRALAELEGDDVELLRNCWRCCNVARNPIPPCCWATGTAPRGRTTEPPGRAGAPDSQRGHRATVYRHHVRAPARPTIQNWPPRSTNSTHQLR